MGTDVAAGAGGIGQSFLVSNKFSDVDPELARGYSVWVGHWVYLLVVEGWILHFEVWLFDMGPQQTVL